eukprot:gnl/MRDRNA2_/MRDRNA2_70728_c0_seq1.p1 gnl/MRDRNA2_/MRDRNA2_70728_c0~~gnl/MRDRNA2_/MRDRNA2_70728_c0_seq1.p1  ORF type:complete len:391 (+),score=74.14 gnl/MRDRNA2_/MRDRNA2_70728_c0_seq1:57-1175(+)
MGASPSPAPDFNHMSLHAHKSVPNGCERCMFLELQLKAAVGSLVGLGSKCFSWAEAENFNTAHGSKLAATTLQCLKPCEHLDPQLWEICARLSSVEAKLIHDKEPAVVVNERIWKSPFSQRNPDTEIEVQLQTMRQREHLQPGTRDLFQWWDADEDQNQQMTDLSRKLQDGTASPKDDSSASCFEMSRYHEDASRNRKTLVRMESDRVQHDTIFVKMHQNREKEFQSAVVLDFKMAPELRGTFVPVAGSGPFPKCYRNGNFDLVRQPGVGWGIKDAHDSRSSPDYFAYVEEDAVDPTNLRGLWKVWSHPHKKFIIDHFSGVREEHRVYLSSHADKSISRANPSPDMPPRASIAPANLATRKSLATWTFGNHF